LDTNNIRGYFLKHVKMKKEILLYFALLLWFVVPAQAQLTMFAEDLEAEKGETVIMDFTVVDFDSISAIQLTLNWDSTLLVYKSVTATDSLPNLNEVSNFNPKEANELRFLWFPPNAHSLADSSIIFSVEFEAICQGDSLSSVSFSNTDVQFIKDGKETSTDLIATDGSVKVMCPTHTFNVTDLSSSLYQNAPNPFNDFTFVKFETQKVDDVEFQVFDLEGKMIYSHKEKYGRGLHQIKLEKNLFPSSGTYFYRIVSSAGIATKKLIAIK